MLKVLLLGSTGLLGTAFQQLLGQRPDLEFDSPEHQELDVLDELSLHQYLSKFESLDLVINCIGYNLVDEAERLENYEKCLELNVKFPENLAKILQHLHQKAQLIHFSSDYVFDGRADNGYAEDDSPNPLSVYGKSKMLSEKAVLRGNPAASVVRLSWLFGPGKKNFLTTMSDLYKKNGKVQVVADQHGKPTYTLDVAKYLLDNFQILENQIYHLPNETIFSWFEFAKYSLNMVYNEVNIEPIRSETLDRLAKRPTYAVLKNSKLPLMRSGELAIKDYINNYL